MKQGKFPESGSIWGEKGTWHHFSLKLPFLGRIKQMNRWMNDWMNIKSRVCDKSTVRKQDLVEITHFQLYNKKLLKFIQGSAKTHFRFMAWS